jgi:hypothetical protein
MVHSNRFNRGLSIFQWGITLVGVAVLLAAAFALLQRPKQGASRAAHAVQRIAGIGLAILGLGIIAYAWLGFSPM